MRCRELWIGWEERNERKIFGFRLDFEKSFDHSPKATKDEIQPTNPYTSTGVTPVESV
jgi:hypothetical protein